MEEEYQLNPDLLDADDIMAEVYELTKLGYIDLVNGLDIQKKSVEVEKYRDNWMNYLCRTWTESCDYTGEVTHHINDEFWLTICKDLWVYLHRDAVSLSNNIKYHESDIEVNATNLNENNEIELKNLLDNESVIDNPHLNYILAIYYYNNNNFIKSLELFQLSAIQHPGVPSSAFYCDWGKAFYQIREVAKGNEKFQSAIKNSPNKWWVYNYWSEVLTEFYQVEKSLEVDKQTLELNPKNIKVYENIAFRLVFNKTNYENELNEVIYKVIVNCSNIQNFYQLLGIRLFENKSYEKSVKILEKALINNPTCPETHSYFARALYKSGVLEKADKEFELAFLLDSKNELQSIHYKDWKLLKLKCASGYSSVQEIPKTEILKNFDLDDKSLFDNYKEWAEMVSYKHGNGDAIKIMFELYFLDNNLAEFNKFPILYQIYKFYVNEKDQIRMGMVGNWIKEIGINSEDYKKEFIKKIKITTGIDFPNIEKLYYIKNKKSVKQEKRVTLVVTPNFKKGNKHKNSLIWYDEWGEPFNENDVGNDPFDLLYYLAWLNENNLEKGIKIDSPISNTYKNKICKNHLRKNRFTYKWCEGDDAQLGKKKSIINNYFKFDLIIKNGTVYHINPDINIELIPYPTDQKTSK